MISRWKDRLQPEKSQSDDACLGRLPSRLRQGSNHKPASLRIRCDQADMALQDRGIRPRLKLGAVFIDCQGQLIIPPVADVSQHEAKDADLEQAAFSRKSASKRLRAQALSKSTTQHRAHFADPGQLTHSSNHPKSLNFSTPRISE